MSPRDVDVLCGVCTRLTRVGWCLFAWLVLPSPAVVGSATLAGVGFSALGMAQQQTQQSQQQQTQQTQQSQQQSQQQQPQQTQQTLAAAVAATYGNSSLGTIGSPAVLGPLSTGIFFCHLSFFLFSPHLPMSRVNPRSSVTLTVVCRLCQGLVWVQAVQAEETPLTETHLRSLHHWTMGEGSGHRAMVLLVSVPCCAVRCCRTNNLSCRHRGRVSVTSGTCRRVSHSPSLHDLTRRRLLGTGSPHELKPRLVCSARR